MYEQRNRHGENGTIPFRTGRYYAIKNVWWFSIRKGPEQGPFTSKTAARRALIEYLNELFELERNLENNRLVLMSKAAVAD